MIACFKSQGWEENQMETPRHQDRMLHWGYNGESAWTAKVIYFFYALSLQRFGRISRAAASLKILSFIGIKNKSLKAVIGILA